MRKGCLENLTPTGYDEGKRHSGKMSLTYRKSLAEQGLGEIGKKTKFTSSSDVQKNVESDDQLCSEWTGHITELDVLNSGL